MHCMRLYRQNIRCFIKNIIRYAHGPNHWSVIRKQVQPIHRALKHFDEYYEPIFGAQWPSIREGLLGKQKYVAIVNNYGDSAETKACFEKDGALNVRTLFRVTQKNLLETLPQRKRQQLLDDIKKLDEALPDDPIMSNQDIQSVETPIDNEEVSLHKSLATAQPDYSRLVSHEEQLNEFIPVTKLKGREDYIPENKYYTQLENSDSGGLKVKIEREYDLPFPDHLDVYCYEATNNSPFRAPTNASTDVKNYYLMDGGSLLPILALDLQANDYVLDMCAAPGGKSLLAIQSLLPRCVVSNDSSCSRVRRIEQVYRQFLFDLDTRWLQAGRVQITQSDGRDFSVGGGELYDKVLVDAPCTTDRHSLIENDNNIFRSTRIKERIKIPEMQAELLISGLKCVKNGGNVVYSTCTLSPAQNDGVVHMALQHIWQDTNMQFVVKDLHIALLQCANVFKLANTKLMKYGSLVLPCISQNYGPTYFCKLHRVK